MKLIYKTALLLVTLIMLTLSPVFAGDNGANEGQEFQIRDADFSISGTSNVRDWEIKSETLTGVIRTGNAFLQTGEDGHAPENWFEEVSLTIPANSLDSGINTMNNTMHETLDSDENPEITYYLESVESVRNGDSEQEYVLRIHGRAQAAGSYHQMTHEVIVVRENPQVFQVTGEFEVRFSDFEMEPPSFMRGALKTGDEIEVRFRFTMGPK